MNGNGPNNWLSPSNLIAALGMIGMIITSYRGFQDDTAKRLADLDRRLALVEYRVDRLEHK